MAIFCSACGKEIEPGVKFCGACGAQNAVAADAPAAGADAAAADTVVAATASASSASVAEPNAAPDIAQSETSAATQGAAQTAAQGAPSSGQQSSQQFLDNLMKIAQNTADHTEGLDPADIEKNKVLGCAAYILFFLPLVAAPESKYGRFHANQGLLYLILFVAASIATTILRMVLVAITWRLLWLSSLISFLVFLPIVAIGVVGLVNGYTGKAKDLPLIGTIRLLK